MTQVTVSVQAISRDNKGVQTSCSALSVKF